MKFSELVDIDGLREICESFTDTTGAVTAILDLEGNVLIATGWQDICVRFHRVNPATETRCRESDTMLAGALQAGEPYIVYRCKNGLVDVAVPISIRGEHVANFFTGQFFTQPPDIDYFARQADEFGFENGPYLEALKKVPIFSEQKIRSMMSFFTGLAQLIGEMGFARKELEESNLKFRQEIEEHRRTETALKASELRFRTLVENLPVKVFVKNRESVYISCNPSYARDLGIDPDDITGTTDYDYFPDDLAEKYRTDDSRVMASLQGEEIEEQFRSGDQNKWIATIKVPLRDEADKVTGVLGVFWDITERRRAQEENAKLETQLLQAQKMECVGQLAGGVAHDFNNMLLVILGHAGMALDQVDSAQPIYANLLEIREAAERSANLTRQLLAFARKQTIVPRVLDLNEAVEGMLKMLQRLIGEDINLVWKPGAALWPVKIDPSQLDQVLVNLCINARDAISGVGKVAIETGNSTFDEACCADNPSFIPGEYVRISVNDNGCGMEKDTLLRIFEPFFTTKKIGCGTGLGLATVYGAIRQNSGFISVQSEKGAGTAFTIYLPRQEGDAAVQTRPEAAPGQPSTRQVTILLVEDELAILNLTAKMLEKLNYTVLTANTVGEAIRLAREHCGEIRLLLTDVVMPEMNGRDLTKSLQSFCPNLRYLFMSGYTPDVIVRDGVLGEGEFFIQKPFSIKELALKVRQALDGE